MIVHIIVLQLSQPQMSFDHGTINITHASMLEIPNTKYDERSKTLRAFGMYYASIVEYLVESEILYTDSVPNYLSVPALFSDVVLRDYQRDSITRWKKASMRGCVILPTGSGKTAIGMSAICEANTSALVVVPTIDLLQQWADFLQTHLRIVGYANDNLTEKSAIINDQTDNNLIKIGKLGGGSDEICAVTVATYDSAYLRAPEIGNRFGLLIFDEVHHLPAPGYKLIAEQCMAPFRLGLTATLEREDGLHKTIPRLVGGVVYSRGTRELAEKKHLAKYEIQKIRVNLSIEEKTEYDKCRSEFLVGLNKLGMKNESMYNLKRLILMSNRNQNARKALLARNRANEIAFNTSAKITHLRKILAENCGGGIGDNDTIYDNDTLLSDPTSRKKTIIFTQNNKMAYLISDTFLIPIITHKTSKSERKEILDGFRTGRYVSVVTSRVLDEGVDVPDAELGIIVSGTGSGREMVQRLGRLLRPKKDGSRALLIEMISDATREVGSSARRSAALRKNAGARHRHRRRSIVSSKNKKTDAHSVTDRSISQNKGGV